jgi:cell division protein FtsQ
MARIISASKKPYNKNALRKIRLFIDNLIFIYKFLFFVVCVGFCLTLYFSEKFSKKVADVVYDNIIARPPFDFTLKNVYLEGHHYVNNEEIIKTLSMFINIGEPILNISLNKIKNKLETIDWIENVIIERRLPSTLFIKIIEKKPSAIWQYKGKLYLIDQNGKTITTNKVNDFEYLVLLVGQEAPLHFNHLLSWIRGDEKLFQKIAVVTRVGQRRWNIKLDNGIEIKLPEKGEKEAWQWFGNLYHKNKLDSEIKVIDLRIPGKIYINGEIKEVEF